MPINYMPQIVLACAFTSVSIHLLNQRRDAQTERLRYSAQVGALEDVVQRLRAGEMVSDAEITKIRRRVGLLQKDTAAASPTTTGIKGSLPKRKAPQEITEDQALSEWSKAVQDSAEDDQRPPSLLQALFRGQNSTYDTPYEKKPVETESTVPKEDRQESPSRNPKRPIFY